MTDAPIEAHIIEWNAIRIEVRWCQSWSESFERIYGRPLAHLEIESINPAKVPLPMTETGYRSHFTHPDEIEGAGGPIPFVRAWLSEAAKDPNWIAAEEGRKQLSLF